MTEKDPLADRLAALLNEVSREQDSDTPDFILAEFMVGALEAFELGVNRRERWYGRPHNAVPTLTEARIRDVMADLDPLYGHRGQWIEAVFAKLAALKDPKP